MSLQFFSADLNTMLSLSSQSAWRKRDPAPETAALMGGNPFILAFRPSVNYNTLLRKKHISSFFFFKQVIKCYFMTLRFKMNTQVTDLFFLRLSGDRIENFGWLLTLEVKGEDKFTCRMCCLGSGWITAAEAAQSSTGPGVAPWLLETPQCQHGLSW